MQKKTSSVFFLGSDGQQLTQPGDDKIIEVRDKAITLLIRKGFSLQEVADLLLPLSKRRDGFTLVLGEQAVHLCGKEEPLSRLLLDYDQGIRALVPGARFLGAGEQFFRAKSGHPLLTDSSFGG